MFALPDARISGRLIASPGTDLSGVSVHLLNEANAGWSRPARADGSFEFVGLWPGTYRLGLNWECGATADKPYARAFAGGTSNASEARRYVIDGPVQFDQQEIAFEVRRATSMRVRVLATDGTPRAGVVIRLEKECGNQFRGSLHNPARTDDDGWITQPVLLGDRWRVRGFAKDLGCFDGPYIGPDAVPDEVVLTLPEKMPLYCN